MNQLQAWLRSYPLEPIDVDCVTTVMLKILDGKCKMKAEEKIVMTRLYDAVKNQYGVLFDDEAIHPFIKQSRQHIDDELRNEIYEKRLMAETMLSRPVMKAFKAKIRQQGIFLLHIV